MNHQDKTGSVSAAVVPGLHPGHGYYEVSVTDAKTLQALSGYVANYEGSSPRTRIVEVIPSSTAYNTIKAV